MPDRQKLRPEDSGCGFVRPYPADRIAHRPGQVLGQIPYRSGASRGDIGKCIAVQQGENAPGGEGGYLCALDNGGVLPVCLPQEHLARLQVRGVVTQIAHGLGAPGIGQAHRDPPAGVGLLGPVAHGGGKEVAAAALFPDGVSDEVTPAPAVQQSRRQRQGDEDQGEPQPLGFPKGREQKRRPTQNRQPCRGPEGPGPLRQIAQQRQRRGEGKRYGSQGAHRTGPPSVYILCRL